jgi:carbon-monoxide dehydrogenase small subunit
VTRHQVAITANGETCAADVEPRTLLVHFIREEAGLTGTHVGCDTSDCGACTVLLDGEPVKSCTILAVQADGHEITTVEGLAGRPLTPVQQGLERHHGLQCGFCTPGVVMSATALLAEDPQPSERRIRDWLKGNLCRCTGYQTIVDAVQWAAEHGGPGPARGRAES